VVSVGNEGLDGCQTENLAQRRLTQVGGQGNGGQSGEDGGEIHQMKGRTPLSRQDSEAISRLQAQVLNTVGDGERNLPGRTVSKP
jgi:hypothetical protein